MSQIYAAVNTKSFVSNIKTWYSVGMIEENVPPAVDLPPALDPMDPAIERCKTTMRPDKRKMHMKNVKGKFEQPENPHKYAINDLCQEDNYNFDCFTAIMLYFAGGNEAYISKSLMVPEDFIRKAFKRYGVYILKEDEELCKRIVAEDPTALDELVARVKETGVRTGTKIKISASEIAPAAKHSSELSVITAEVFKRRVGAQLGRVVTAVEEADMNSLKAAGAAVKVLRDAVETGKTIFSLDAAAQVAVAINLGDLKRLNEDSIQLD